MVLESVSTVAQDAAVPSDCRYLPTVVGSDCVGRDTGAFSQLMLPAVEPAVSILPLLVVKVAGTCRLPSVVG